MDVMTSSKRLEDRVALITGSRGIGRSIAVKFAQEGADLFLCATNMEKLKETREQASKWGKRIATFSNAVDVADRSAVEAIVQKAIEVFGRIDILVNNAGIYKPSPFVDLFDERFMHYQAHLWMVPSTMYAIDEDMLKRSKGKSSILLRQQVNGPP